MLGYAEIRELFADAGVLADPSRPEEMPPAARDDGGAGKLRTYALADAFLDQGSYETFVVGIIGDAMEARRAARDHRARLRQKAADLATGILDDADEESSPVRDEVGGGRRRSRSDLRRRKGRRKGKRDKINADAEAIKEEARVIREELRAEKELLNKEQEMKVKLDEELLKLKTAQDVEVLASDEDEFDE